MNAARVAPLLFVLILAACGDEPGKDWNQVPPPAEPAIPVTVG